MMQGFNNIQSPEDTAEDLRQFKFLYNSMKVEIDLIKA